MRFISAQWLTMLSDDVWKKHALHGNTMAQRLATGLSSLPGVQILYPTEANAVFAKLPDPLIHALKEHGWRFYNFIGGCSRLMCSWRVTPEDIDALLADARAAL
jgi:threonine aldolase